MKIGIFGGTFDPIHKGHVAVGLYALKQFRLDRVLFVLSARPPHKQKDKPVASVQHRLAMVRLALRRYTRLKASNLEVNRRGLSFTIDTIKFLKKRYPKARFYFILGQDSYEDMKHWREADEIKREVQFLVAGRPGYRIKKQNEPDVSRIRMPLCHAASSMIRKAIAKDPKSVTDLPSCVIRYIKRHGLYRGRA